MSLKWIYLPMLGVLLLTLTSVGCAASTGGGGSALGRLYEDFWDTRPEGPRVLLARMDKAGRLVILAKDLGLPAEIQEPDPLPYSENASGAVWVGTRFPFEKAIKLLFWARNYYTGLRYIALSDYVNTGTNRFDQDLFIGGATETAVTRLNLSAWQDADWQALRRVGSEAEFHALIRSRYPAVAAPETR